MSGFSKIKRLEFLAQVCPPLQLDALKMALVETKAKTQSVAKYNVILQTLNGLLVLSNTAPVDPDVEWMDSTSKYVRTQLEKLEAELKNYKNNLIKESIRMGHQDLGDLHFQAGDFQNALKCYSKTRDYCTTSKHMVDMCMNIIKVSCNMSNANHIQNYAAKAEGSLDSPDKPAMVGKLKCYMGIANLETGKYKAAARCFLDVPFELSSSLPDVVTSNDIAIYGGLCALATFDRDELKRRVFDNSDFKSYLETESRIRQALFSFYHSNYSVCLQILKDLRNELLLDVYIHAHVDALCESIRHKAMVQYFSPFLTVDLEKMAGAFNVPVSELEQELSSLILKNQIQARIDSHGKILKRKLEDQRTKVFDKVLKLGVDYSVQTKSLLLRVLLLRQDMSVTSEEER
ncbi:cop9 signalosome complex subunit [Phlyctochytrium planicorne]|nr:cop9 signalosome complex subunit [Phlyctochytrium planicorne]